jgi:regulatory protein
VDAEKNRKERPSCDDCALRLLGSRAHFRAELRQKLLRRGYAPEEVEATLAQLAAAGHLDDARLAREEGARLADRKGLSRRGVAFELRRKGAPDEAIDGALEGAGDDAARALESARRWLRTHAPDAAALGRHLARKGYGQSVIFRTLNELAPVTAFSPGE